MPIGIPIREFARRAGCDEKVVRRKVKTGHLPTFSDGSLDTAYLNVDWRKGDRPSADSAVTSFQTADTTGPYRGPPAPWSKSEAERVKENYAALLRQLVYERESVAVVTIDDAALAIIMDFAAVRSRCAQIAGNAAPLVLGLSRTAEIKSIIDREIIAALEQLSAVEHNL